MKTTSVKGTNDYLPQDEALRDFVQSKIVEIYKANGFEKISTPILEDIENLVHSDGGDNLSLIYKILKRGEKFENCIEQKKFDDLADLGLRYDLTLPLSRFYAEHKNELPMPFKVIQIGKVYRAERPQKGRNREFVQCDIDIVGSNSVDAEIELISTTANALLAIGLKDFCIKINNRKILRKILADYCGFDEASLDAVCISFDKLEKIGMQGVSDELLAKNYSSECVEKLAKLCSKLPQTFSQIKLLCGNIPEVDEVKKIISAIEELSGARYSIKFDLTLVRGQGYYTGSVFEISSNQFSCSLGGGGRYDNLIGKFCKQDVPAVGFSIGFERIFSLLKEKNFCCQQKKKVVAFYDAGNVVEAIKLSSIVNQNYDVTICEKSKKFGKQLSNFESRGFFGFVVVGGGRQVKKFKN